MKSLLALLFLTTSALAQTPEQYTVTLTPAELDMLGTLLGKQPYENVYQVIGKIQMQVNEQRNAAKAPAPQARLQPHLPGSPPPPPPPPSAPSTEEKPQ